MNFFQSQNIFVNTVMLPGSLAKSTYTTNSFQGIRCTKLLYIPFKGTCTGNLNYFTAQPSSIPALLVMKPNNDANKFCIHFHGNACDIKQIHGCAMRESRELDAHYLMVEYPRFGISDGHPNEAVMNEIAKTVYYYVVNELRVHYSRVVLIGRSIGSGPVCTLASDLEVLKTPVAAVILQSPYTSIRDAASDILGCVSFFILDRWVNWMYLVGTGPEVIRSPILFIHADNDKIINCSHSKLLHEHRLKHNLPSEIFIQQSTHKLLKGHNIYEYEKDVVAPSKQFLRKLDLQAGPKLITLDLRTIEKCAAIPDKYKKRFCPDATPNATGTTTLMTGTTNSSNSNSDNIDHSENAHKDDPLDKRSEGCLVCSWSLCCCSFCAECCVALNYQLLTTVYHRVTCSVPIFDYSQLRPQEVKDQASFNNIFHLDRFDETVAPPSQKSAPAPTPTPTPIPTHTKSSSEGGVGMTGPQGKPSLLERLKNRRSASLSRHNPMASSVTSATICGTTDGSDDEIEDINIVHSTGERGGGSGSIFSPGGDRRWNVPVLPLQPRGNVV
jgi:hypothetical protein